MDPKIIAALWILIGLLLICFEQVPFRHRPEEISIDKRHIPMGKLLQMPGVSGGLCIIIGSLVWEWMPKVDLGAVLFPGALVLIPTTLATLIYISLVLLWLKGKGLVWPLVFFTLSVTASLIAVLLLVAAPTMRVLALVPIVSPHLFLFLLYIRSQDQDMRIVVSDTMTLFLFPIAPPMLFASVLIVTGW